MHFARKLFLLAAMAMAAMAFATSSASAQTTVEVYQETGEGTMSHCDPVHLENHIPTGGCSIRAVSQGNIDLYIHNGTSEVLFSRCSNVFEARVGEDGEGYIYNQQLTPEGGLCGREPCDESASGPNPHRNTAWPFHIEESGGPTEGEETMFVTFCLYTHSATVASEGTQGTPCQVEIDITRVGHDYTFRSHPHDGAGNGGSPCANPLVPVELEGRWISQPSDNHPQSLEIVHHNDQA